MNTPQCLDCKADLGDRHRGAEHYVLSAYLWRYAPQFVGGTVVTKSHCGIGWAECPTCGERAGKVEDINHRC